LLPFLAAAIACAACGPRTATSPSNPTPVPSATATPGARPQLRPANLRAELGHGSDAYEPNDAAPYYLGAGTTYTITDGYLDPVDVTWTADVVNDGGDVYDSFDVALHVGDAVLTQTLDGIHSGETRTVTFTSRDVNPGTLSAWLDVDSHSKIEESDESDNASS